MSRITAALAWYAETPETLDRCVRSLSGYCDSLVALGGRWYGFPDVPGDNQEEQAETIADACEATGLVCKIGLGEWDSQVEKRADLMLEAGRESDWILVIDGDEFIDRGDPEKFREGLDETELDVARVHCYRIPIPYGRDIQRVYRSSTKVTVVTAHNGYMAEDGRFLNGDPCYVDLMPHEELGEFLVVAHDLTCRSQDRKNARKAYKLHRHKSRIESWV